MPHPPPMTAFIRVLPFLHFGNSEKYHCKNPGVTRSNKSMKDSTVLYCVLFSQPFQALGEMWSYYNGKWFLSHHFGFRSSGKLKFGLNTHMT